MKDETRHDDGMFYWAYSLILCVHHDPGKPIATLDEYFKMKEGSMQELHDRTEEGVMLSEFERWLVHQYKSQYGTSIGTMTSQERGKRLARVCNARAEVQAGTSFYV
jgi:hypothetical protein